ncbi:hypothetical protein B8W72_22660 [Pseudomonas putida]|uniref:Uncharacterized protein n=1 Tax=Pseudomonas putida TaxID=303 RepID=A0A1Y3KPG9_PSEPU|nr:hypothetical protein B8W72_22660 [Pseudomonas putida]
MLILRGLLGRCDRECLDMKAHHHALVLRRLRRRESGGGLTRQAVNIRTQLITFPFKVNPGIGKCRGYWNCQLGKLHLLQRFVVLLESVCIHPIILYHIRSRCRPMHLDLAALQHVVFHMDASLQGNFEHFASARVPLFDAYNLPCSNAVGLTQLQPQVGQEFFTYL